MVEDYLSEREQAEALRDWWKENWRWIIGGIALGFAVLGAWNYYKVYRDQRAEDASKLYHELQAAVTKQDLEAATRTLTSMTSKHAASPYTQQGRFLIAKLR